MGEHGDPVGAISVVGEPTASEIRPVKEAPCSVPVIDVAVDTRAPPISISWCIDRVYLANEGFIFSVLIVLCGKMLKLIKFISDARSTI